MNYIHTLQDENKQLKSDIQDLRVYLHSSKFYNDTTVQVQDVLNRLPRVTP